MTTVIATGCPADDKRLTSIALALVDAAVVRYDAQGLGPSVATAQALTFFTAVMVAQRPTLVIVIGDGPEMLAAALAALFLKVPVTHLGGAAAEIGEFGAPLRECIAHIAGVHWHD